MSKPSALVALAVVGLLALTFAAYADKDAATKPVLSGAAADAITKAFPKATVGKVKAEEEDGLKMFEVRLTDGTTKMEVSVSEDGIIAEVGTKAAVGDLPKAAADAIAKAAPGAEIKEVQKEEVRAEPKLTALDKAKVEYELILSKDGRTGEIKYAQDGTVVEKLSWQKKKSKEGKSEEGDAKEAAPVTLPEKAAAALKAAFPNATTGAAKIESDEGVKVYEVAMKDGDTPMEVEVTDDGLIVEVEWIIPAKDMPKAVADAAAKLPQGIEVKEVQRQEVRAVPKLTVLDRARVVFEVELAKDGKEGEIKVAADGAVLEPVKWEADDEEDKENEKGKENEDEQEGHVD